MVSFFFKPNFCFTPWHSKTHLAYIYIPHGSWRVGNLPSHSVSIFLLCPFHGNSAEIDIEGTLNNSSELGPVLPNEGLADEGIIHVTQVDPTIPPVTWELGSSVFSARMNV